MIPPGTEKLVLQSCLRFVLCMFQVMLTLEAVHLQNAMCAPLPGLPLLPSSGAAPQPPQTDDELLLGPSQRSPTLPSSFDMLSMCFNNLFTQLPRINLDSLLLAWLTLDDEACFEVKGEVLFDATRVPSIPLNSHAVSALLAALAWAPSPVPVKTWVLAFHTLSLLANLKCGGGGGGTEQTGGERWLASCMVADPNIMTVLSKFLSSASGDQVRAYFKEWNIKSTLTDIGYAFYFSLNNIY